MIIDEVMLPVPELELAMPYYLKGARDLCRSLDLMKKQCVVGSTQLSNRCLLRQRIFHLPAAYPRIDLASWSLALNVVGAQEGSLHKTPDDIVCKAVWTPRPLTHRVIASTPS